MIRSVVVVLALVLATCGRAAPPPGSTRPSSGTRNLTSTSSTATRPAVDHQQHGDHLQLQHQDKPLTDHLQLQHQDKPLTDHLQLQHQDKSPMDHLQLQHQEKPPMDHLQLQRQDDHTASPKPFHGHKVLRIVPATEQQVRDLRAFLNDHPTLDTWLEPTVPQREVDFRMSPNDTAVVNEFLAKQGITPKEMITDLGRLVDEEQRHMSDAKRSNVDFGWENYHTLEEINAWLAAMVKKHPTKAALIEGGNTYENRKILGLRIKFAEGELPVAFIEAGIHAREWVSPATATFLINELLTREDEEFKRQVQDFEWHIFPSTNPDGYVYTHRGDRLWRKSRSRNVICRGADLNRNWPIHWAEVGTNPFPCADTYPGPRPESEVETRGLRSYLDSLLTRNNNTVRVYVSLHSYSNMLMFPWGYTAALPEHFDELNAIAVAAASSAAKRYGTKLRTGPIAGTIYPAAGNTVDYAYERGVRFPFVFELRDDGTYGFLLPKEQIKPTAEETVDAILTIASEAAKRM